MKQLFPALLASVVCSLLIPISTARAQGTALSFQGRLNDGAGPANGTYDFQFTVRDTLTGGNALGANPLAVTLTVSNGLFTATLDPGAGVFTGAERWLEIAVRTNGAALFTTLDPRQKITATPYAVTAGNVTGAISLGQLPGALVTNGASGVTFSGTFSGNAVGLTNFSSNVALRAGGNAFTGDQTVNGNVGIGLTDPKSALQVVGTVTADRFVSAADPVTNVIPVLGMAWIKPGTFIMGSRTDEPGHGSDEEPQTVVTLTRGFWMGVHEVTQGEYAAVIGSNPSFFKGDTNRPVEQVNWPNATNYCRRLTIAERTAGRIPAGWGYRLPTEAEWEYCCRGGARTTRFCYGDDLSAVVLGNYAWHSANNPSIGPNTGEQKLANAWGLMDMHGNLWEWCQDLYGPYAGGSVTDPQGAFTGTYRVVRGGAWGAPADFCRSAFRSITHPLTDTFFNGFRVVLSPGQP